MITTDLKFKSVQAITTTHLVAIQEDGTLVHIVKRGSDNHYTLMPLLIEDQRPKP